VTVESSPITKQNFEVQHIFTLFILKAMYRSQRTCCQLGKIRSSYLKSLVSGLLLSFWLLPVKCETTSQKNEFVLRLHLIRHGETESNSKNLVLGQTDSPLTQNGIQQSKAANRSMMKQSFWKRYASDLLRAENTARIILGLDGEDDESSSCDAKETLILDKRLRERAKGVREGRDKDLTYDEAYRLFREERFGHDGVNDNDDTNEEDLPLLETEEEVWFRVKDWIEELLDSAYNHYLQHDEYSSYDIFAVTHSGTLRILIEKMVGEQIPREKNLVKQERLAVPNTSTTIIEIYPRVNGQSRGGQPFPTRAAFHSDMKENSLEIKLITLTCIQHLEGVTK